MSAPVELVDAPTARAAPDWTVKRWFNAEALGTAPRLADLEGRVVALHAFQMLCPGCVLHGIPQAQRIEAAFSRRDVVVIGLHCVFEHHDAMGPEALAAFLHEFRVRFPVGVDAASPDAAVPRTMSAFGMRGTQIGRAHV